jgi:hypothetical protein
MKQIILAAMYVLSLNILVGQEEKEDVWRIWYMKPVQGKAKQMQDGIKDHVAKHHGDGKWPEYYYDVLSGPNFGSLMGWSGPHTWKAFDERERSEADVDHWIRYVAPYVDNSKAGTDFLVFHPELSYERPQSDGPWPPIFHLSWNYIGPGRGADYMDVAKAAVESKTKNDSENYHRIYHTASGTNPDAWLYEYPVESMEELKKSAGSGGGAGWEKSFCKAKADDLRQKYQSSVKSRMREIIKERKDLSSPAPTSAQDDN